MRSLKSDAIAIFDAAVRAMLPGEAVTRALRDFRPSPEGEIVLIAVGKASWEMASAAVSALGSRIARGCVVTKYGHSRGEFAGHEAIEIYESGHPVPDENGIEAGARVLDMTRALSRDDTVLFLVSGGGSALFEAPLPGVSLADLELLNGQLLASGADIVEINTLRKRFSAVKGGRFAEHCSPASVYQITLSDVLGDRLDSIASGPAWPDSTTCAEARRIVSRRGVTLSPAMSAYLDRETPKKLENVTAVIAGSVGGLCLAAKVEAERMGYNSYILSSSLDCEARELGRVAGAIAREISNGASSFEKPCAVIMGGETVVSLKGSGRGGRNQETALSAAGAISGLGGAVILSGGSDGTDGPTDAAGGVVDGETWGNIQKNGMDPYALLDDNDSYNALSSAGALLVTGPTGTNVNDLVIIICQS